MSHFASVIFFTKNGSSRQTKFSIRAFFPRESLPAIFSVEMSKLPGIVLHVSVFLAGNLQNKETPHGFNNVFVFQIKS